MLLVTPCFAKDVQEEDQYAVQTDFLPPLDLQCSLFPESHSVDCNNSLFPEEQTATSGLSALLFETPKFRRLDRNTVPVTPNIPLHSTPTCTFHFYAARTVLWLD